MPSPRAVNVRTKGRCRSASAERPAALRPVLSERSSPRAIRSRDASAPEVGAYLFGVSYNTHTLRATVRWRDYSYHTARRVKPARGPTPYLIT